MSNNIIEQLRKESVDRLFATKGFDTAWKTWKPFIRRRYLDGLTNNQILNLGDNLYHTFYTTNKKNQMPDTDTSDGRTQSEVSGGGANWEALVCWYLNLCSIGRRTVIIKHNKKLIPEPISNAITVNYGNFTSNTESDLIAITFPDKDEFSCNIDDIEISDQEGTYIPPRLKSGRYQTNKILTALCDKYFNELEIHIIQCKTNWNDNAQIPMLWNMIYSADGFRTDIKVGKNGYSITDIKHFTYSFVTVPTIKLDKIKPTSVCVKRVSNLSGGNYWGLESKSNIAYSVKEMLQRVLKTGHSLNHLSTIKKFVPELSTTYSYFNL